MVGAPADRSRADTGGGTARVDASEASADEEAKTAVSVPDPTLELRHLRAQVGRLEEEVERLTELLAGRDEDIRQLRAKIVGRMPQVGVGGAEAHGAQIGNAR